MIVARLVLLLLLAAGAAVAEPADDLDPATRALVETRLAISREQLAARRLLPRGSASPVVLGWPLRARDGFPHPGHHAISNFVDLDPTGPDQVLDWNCGTRSYDLASGYDHAGIDIFVWPFPWRRMFADDVTIVAAAPGVILEKEDGHFDRSCAFENQMWNAVYVLHADDSVAWYGHMKSGSTTAKGVGEPVALGEYLGLVGSSGPSTAPHLHFELHDAAGQVADPFTGPCHAAPSLWADQPPYYDSALNQISTHDAEPETLTCNQAEATRERTHFAPGEVVNLVTFYRDQLAGQVSTHTLRRPNGTVFATWQHAPGDHLPHLAASYWTFNSTLPSFAPHGVWHFEVSYLDQFESVAFTVPEPDATALALAAALALAWRRALHER